MNTNAPEHLRGINTQEHLNEEATHTVVEHVQPQGLTQLQHALTAQPQQQRHTQQVPQRLVQERRMEQRTRRILGREITARRANLQAPRQSRRLAEQLLVEPVTPAAKRLSQQNTRRYRIRKSREIHAIAAATIPGAQRTDRHGTHNADAALPNLQESPRISNIRTEIATRVSNQHMVGAGTNNARRNSPHRHVKNAFRGTTRRLPTARTQPQAHRHTRKNTQGIEMHTERAQLQVRNARRGNRSQHVSYRHARQRQHIRH